MRFIPESKVEQNLPTSYVRTPQKYAGEKHFEWLIDYQVTPYKFYKEIAEANLADKKTIREPLKQLAQTLGLSLRKPIRGRPSGVRNSEKSVRQIAIFAK